jgi:hypothetical protein
MDRSARTTIIIGVTALLAYATLPDIKKDLEEEVEAPTAINMCDPSLLEDRPVLYVSLDHHSSGNLDGYRRAESVWRKREDLGVMVLGFHPPTNPEYLDMFVKQSNINFPIVISDFPVNDNFQSYRKN